MTCPSSPPPTPTQEGTFEILRVEARRLESRGTVVLILSEAGGAAPIWISNQTKHELRAQQAGVPVVLVVPPGGTSPYTWDHPHGRHKLILSLPAAGVHFVAGAQPAVISRPRLARLLRRARVELRVAAETALTRFVLREVPAGADRPPAPSAAAMRGGASAAVLRAAAAGAPLDADGWSVALQVPKLGLTVRDGCARELLYMSLHGLRLASTAPGAAHQVHVLPFPPAHTPLTHLTLRSFPPPPASPSPAFVRPHAHPAPA